MYKLQRPRATTSCNDVTHQIGSQIMYMNIKDLTRR